MRLVELVVAVVAFVTRMRDINKELTKLIFRIPSPRSEAHGILEVCALSETLLAARLLTGRMNEAALQVGLLDQR